MKSTFITQIVIMLLGFIISVLVARALGPEGKGQVAYFMLFFGMIARFGNFGINDSLGYYIKKPIMIMKRL
ncbi:oligosaccharide flippase family protein [Bacillus sp. JCM 19034]|uniref:oligosaccharide flippase family protein n=1 Tax=Bacillus sp. JCM 19034 TaxID=1481928 RepID=UPI00351CF3B5